MIFTRSCCFPIRNFLIVDLCPSRDHQDAHDQVKKYCNGFSCGYEELLYVSFSVLLGY